jgi:elongation factor Ts
MNISASLVKDLRERTGSGMMECKKALVEANGDLEAAIEIMRKTGLAKADKKSSRTAAEGCIRVQASADGKSAAMAEINCETDFVAKNEEFIAFADQVARCILISAPADIEAVLAAKPEGLDIGVDERRKELVAKLGENVNVRRFERYVSATGLTASYLHGARIGVLVEIEGGDAGLGKDIAMHVAASKPVCVDESGVSPELIAKEKEIYLAQAADSGKPANIVEKMVEGRIKKFLGEITLAGQPFVKDPEQTVGALLKSKSATVARFVRLEVGEGIEKESSNFAEEVMAQVRASE